MHTWDGSDETDPRPEEHDLAVQTPTVAKFDQAVESGKIRDSRSVRAGPVRPRSERCQEVTSR